MNYTLRRACDDCPFRKVGGIRLTAERVKEIAGGMLDSQGASFTCHKTTVDSGEDDGERVDAPNAQHCAGALIFAEKNENATQLMRIMERLRLYDREKLVGHAEIFDDLDEMLASAIPRRLRRRAKSVDRRRA